MARVATGTTGQTQYQGCEFTGRSPSTQSIAVLVRGTSDSDSYCLSATSASGNVWAYDSEAGGIQAEGYTCA